MDDGSPNLRKKWGTIGISQIPDKIGILDIRSLCRFFIAFSCGSVLRRFEFKLKLEEDGYEVKPLGSGNLKGISFEEGGGYRVNFGGDGTLQYHPEEKSHHGGAYYKISTGGIKHYDLNETEIKN